MLKTKPDTLIWISDMDLPFVYISEERRIQADIREGTTLHVSCFVNGNPTPRVRLSKVNDSGTAILSEVIGHWLNYSSDRGMQSSDTGTFDCVGMVTVLGTGSVKFDINVLCKKSLCSILRVDWGFFFRKVIGVPVITLLNFISNADIYYLRMIEIFFLIFFQFFFFLEFIKFCTLYFKVHLFRCINLFKYLFFRWGPTRYPYNTEHI